MKDIIEKNKFVLVNRENLIIDETFETKPTSYMKDALTRFTKNKSSIIGFVFLSIIVLLAIFVPIFASNNNYLILERIPPKLPLIEKLGILDGKKLRKEVPKSKLTEDSLEYPIGTYEIIREYTTSTGVLVADIDEDIYKKKFGPVRLEKLAEADFNEIPVDFYIGDGNVVMIETSVMGEIYRSYSVTIDFGMYSGYGNNPYFLFGTDSEGNNLWYTAWLGTRLSLIIGITTTIITLIIGVIWGTISGYYGGTIDLVMERIVEIVSGIPSVVIMTLVTLYVGRNIGAVMIIILLTSWIGTASTVRTQFYRYKGQEYVLASRTLGAKDFRIMTRHILPNGIGPIVTRSILMIPSSIFVESTLSYLGLGISGQNPLGKILYNGREYMANAAYLTICPAIIIAVLMISFNLFGNGLRDALNPSLRGAE